VTDAATRAADRFHQNPGGLPWPVLGPWPGLVASLLASTGTCKTLLPVPGEWCLVMTAGATAPSFLTRVGTGSCTEQAVLSSNMMSTATKVFDEMAMESTRAVGW